MSRKNEEYYGRWVRLVRDIKTKGGTEFPKGSVCKVQCVERGTLSLEMKNPDPNNIFGPKYLRVRCVEVWNVELLPDRRPRCPDVNCSHLTCEHNSRTGGCAQCNCEWWPGKEAVERAQKDLTAQKGMKAGPAVHQDEDE